MIKNIIIYDKNEKRFEIKIKNFKSVIYASCKVICGDEVLSLTYKDGNIKNFDSNTECKRLNDYVEGEAEIPLTYIDKLSEIKNSYEMLEYFWNLAATIRNNS